MFINTAAGSTFRAMKVKRLIFLIFSLPFYCSNAQQLVRGTVIEKDSSATLPFVYIINKSNGNGTMSDNEGKFSLMSADNDTIIFSYVGYLKTYIPVRSLKRDAKGMVKIAMTQLPVNLAAVTVTTFKIKPYERDYMHSIIDQSVVKNVDYLRSPISALYMQYSKEGKQIRKLAKIFEELLMEEQVQKKLNRDILVKLTGDEDLDYQAFRKYCYYVSDYFIVTHEGYDLYSRVMDCYKQYKRDRPVLRERRVSDEK